MSARPTTPAPPRTRRPHRPLLASLTLLFAALSCLLTGLAAEALVLTLRHPQAMGDLAKRILDRPLPGTESRALAHLHPSFRGDVDAVISELESKGHTVHIAATFRSPRRQETIWYLSNLGQRLGRGPGTKVRGGQSCHNQVQDGDPASVAVDLRLPRPSTEAEQAAFYKDLGRAARRRGLRWGGDWTRSNPTWAAWDLGWDPGHIESRALCLQLRT